METITVFRDMQTVSLKGRIQCQEEKKKKTETKTKKKNKMKIHWEVTSVEPRQ